ncbi:Oxidoreductase domain-containing protein [Candidatus Magnetoovum chiemensis]|nr:Oxidoreductase domain-containing protein [Candidatus Magnetoovum chiemensis]
MINTAIIGYGNWGPVLVKSFTENPNTFISWICDLDNNRLTLAQNLSRDIKTTTNYRQITNDKDVELVIIAVPVSSHYRLAVDCLRAGKHVLIEKPMARSSAEAHEIIETAIKMERIVFVDHILIYTGAVEKIKQLVASNSIGDIYYFDATRAAMGLYQNDVSVVWDLATHDLAIMDYIIKEKPSAVAAQGAGRLNGRLEDIAFITVQFQSGLIAHFNVSWLSPVKIRRIIISASKKMIVFDDIEDEGKVKIYDNGVSYSRELNNYEYRNGDISTANINKEPPLKTEINHIADCINNNKSPLVSAAHGLSVIRLLEAAQTSIENGGGFVKILG